MARKALLGLSLLALLMGAVAFAAWRATLDYLHSPLDLPEAGGEYLLEPGQTLSHLAADLAQRGWLEHPRWLLTYARLSDRGGHIHAGEYRLAAGTTPLVLLGMLERGEVKQYQVTLVEGWTVHQALAALKQAEALQAVAPPVDQLLQAVAPESGLSHPEGLFFPDTYSYHRGATDLDILRRAYQRMQNVLSEEWQQRAVGLPYETPYEALIMASLVERETGVPGERGRIAGVFVRRLHEGMRLQTDPAVIYGLGSQFDGNLRSRHLQDSSNPYNTYRHGGLPPTPIALAGRAAIHAALHPEPGEALYFVARGDGSHYFSATLEEHLEAVRRFQLQRRADYRSAPAPATQQDSQP